MNRKKSFQAIVTLLGILVISWIAWQATRGQLGHDGGRIVVANSSKIPYQVNLAEICDCYVVTGSYLSDTVYDSNTGEKVKLLPITDNSSTVAIEFSQSLKSVAAITNSGKNVVVRLGSAKEAENVLTTPDGVIASWLKWSGDEKTLIVGTQQVQDFVAAEGAQPTEILAIDLTKKSTTKIISQGLVKQNKIDALYPLAVSNDARRILLSAGTIEDQSFWLWSSQSDLHPLEKNFVWTIYSATAQYNGRTKYLTADVGLHSFDLDTEQETVHPMNGWSDSPISRPSPDGQYVVYLQQDSNRSRGYLTLLSLETGTETRLSDQPLGEFGTMAGSMWSPDSSRFIYIPSYSEPSNFLVVNIQKNKQQPRKLVLPASIQQKDITTLIPKSW